MHCKFKTGILNFLYKILIRLSGGGDDDDDYDDDDDDYDNNTLGSPVGGLTLQQN